MVKKKGASVSSLKKKLWTLFAAYVKARDNNICFTCDKKVFGSSAHAGHLVSRRKNATLFDPENVFCQCAGDNIFKHGDVPEFTRRYINRFGLKKFNALMERSDRFLQWKPYQLEELIEAIRESQERYEQLYYERFY